MTTAPTQAHRHQSPLAPGPLAVVALAAVAMMLPNLLGGRAITGFDAEGGIRAMFKLTAGLGPSQVLLPHLMAGYPYALDNAVSPSPLLWWWARVGYDQGFAPVVMLHLFVTGWGALRWLGALGVGRTVATPAALCWMFSTQMTGHLVIDGFSAFFAQALLPHLFCQALGVVRRPGWHSALGLAAWVAVALIDAHPAIVTATILGACLCALAVAFAEDILRPRQFLWLAAAGLMAIPLCLPVFVGLVVLAQQGPRQGGVGPLATLGGLPVESLLTLWLPGVFGRDVLSGGHLGRGFSSMNTLFVGALWPVLLFSQKRGFLKGTALGLSLVAVLFAFMAIGAPSPVAVVMQQSAFPLSLLRLPVRWAGPVVFLMLTLGAMVLQAHLAQGAAGLRLPRWVLWFFAATVAVGAGLGLTIYTLPAPVLLRAALWLKRNPHRLSGLEHLSAYDWELTGLWLMGETLVMGGLALLTLWLMGRGRWPAALWLSAAAVLLAAVPDLWLTTGYKLPALPVPRTVQHQDRLLSLVTHTPIGGKYLTLYEVLSQGAVGKLLEQGYSPIQASMPLPHGGWQGLLSGSRKDTVETGVRLSPTLLRLLAVKWVVTRDTPHSRCSGRLSDRERTFAIVRGDKAALKPGGARPKGLAWDFLCLETDLLRTYGWEPVAARTPGFRWWRNTRVLSGAYFVTQWQETADPYGDLLRAPLQLLASPPVQKRLLRQPAPAPAGQITRSDPTVLVRWGIQPPDRFIAHLKTPRPGLLVLTVPYYKQYRAHAANGRELKITPVGDALIGIRLPRGEHQLTLTFHYPLWVLRGYALAAWVLAMGLLWWFRIRPEANPPGPL